MLLLAYGSTEVHRHLVSACQTPLAWTQMLGSSLSRVCLHALLLPPWLLAPLLIAPLCIYQCCLQRGRMPVCLHVILVLFLSLLLFALTNAVCRAAEVMREIISLDLRPGVVVYTTLLNAYGVSGDVAAAHKVLHDMRAAGVQPNNFTYSSLMAFHSQAGNVSRILVSPLCSFLQNVLFAANRNIAVFCLLSAFVAVVACIGRQGRICSSDGLHQASFPWVGHADIMSILGSVSRSTQCCPC